MQQRLKLSAASKNSSQEVGSNIKEIIEIYKKHAKPCWGSPKKSTSTGRGSPSRDPPLKGSRSRHKGSKETAASEIKFEIPNASFKNPTEAESFSYQMAKQVMDSFQAGSVDWHQIPAAGKGMEPFVKSLHIKNLGFPVLKGMVECKAAKCSAPAHIGHFDPESRTADLLACNFPHLSQVCARNKADNVTGNCTEGAKGKPVVSLGMLCSFHRITGNEASGKSNSCQRMATFYRQEDLSKPRPFPCVCLLHKTLYESMYDMSLVESFPLIINGEGLLKFEEKMGQPVETPLCLDAVRILVLHPNQADQTTSGVFQRAVTVDFYPTSGADRFAESFFRALQGGKFDKELSQLPPEYVSLLKDRYVSSLRVLVVKGPKSGRTDVPTDQDFVEPLRQNTFLVFGLCSEIFQLADRLAACWTHQTPVNAHCITPTKNNADAKDSAAPSFGDVATQVVAGKRFANKKMKRCTSGFEQLFLQIVRCLPHPEEKHFQQLGGHETINVYLLRIIFFMMHMKRRTISLLNLKTGKPKERSPSSLSPGAQSPKKGKRNAEKPKDRSPESQSLSGQSPKGKRNACVDRSSESLLDSISTPFDLLSAPQHTLTHLVSRLVQDVEFLATFVNFGSGADAVSLKQYLQREDFGFDFVWGDFHVEVSTLWALARPFHRWILRNHRKFLALLACFHKEFKESVQGQNAVMGGSDDTNADSLIVRWMDMFGRETFDETRICVTDPEKKWLNDMQTWSSFGASFFDIKVAFFYKVKRLMRFELQVPFPNSDPNFGLPYSGLSDMYQADPLPDCLIPPESQNQADADSGIM